MSLDSLIARVEVIHDKCRDPKEKKKKEEDEANLDEFGRLKKQIAREIKETRQQIAERNDLLGQTDNTTATAKMSSGIRSRIREVEANIERLKTIQQEKADKLDKKIAKGKKVDEEDIKESQFRTEIVSLCTQHIAECKHLEKQGYGNANTAFFEGYTKSDEPVVSQLPDIDDADFQLLRQNDAKIDVKLSQIGEGVAVLKEIANEMGKEIEMQGVMIAELHTQADKTQAQLNNLNVRLKKTLEKVRQGNRFCIDIILIIIVLAIAGYIYNVTKKK